MFDYFLNIKKAKTLIKKQKIENYITNNLDSDSNEISIVSLFNYLNNIHIIKLNSSTQWASKCYSKLPNLHRSSNNNDIWFSYFNNALKNANYILDLILEDFTNGILESV